jgi:hypothetical protein
MENTVFSYFCRGALPLICLAKSLGADYAENTSFALLLATYVAGIYIEPLPSNAPQYEWWIGKASEGKSHGLFEVISEFFWRDKEKYKKAQTAYLVSGLKSEQSASRM